MKLQTEASELRRNLQQATDSRLQAEQEKLDAQNEVQACASNVALFFFPTVSLWAKLPEKFSPGRPIKTTER